MLAQLAQYSDLLKVTQMDTFAQLIQTYRKTRKYILDREGNAKAENRLSNQQNRKNKHVTSKLVASLLTSIQFVISCSFVL